MRVKEFCTELVVNILSMSCNYHNVFATGNDFGQALCFSVPHCVKEEELQEMRHSAEQLEQQYGHMVDRVLVKEDPASACADLRSILERLEREAQWVPVSWVRT